LVSPALKRGEKGFHKSVTESRRDGARILFMQGPIMENKMDQNSTSVRAILKRPSAILPMAMSLTALAIVLGHIAIYGAAREADEGAAAHLWQLLMAAQLPVVAFFAIKWLPRAPRQALIVLAEQAGAALASVAVVFHFNL